jgi:hypothetical protein
MNRPSRSTPLVPELVRTTQKVGPAGAATPPPARFCVVGVWQCALKGTTTTDAINSDTPILLKTNRDEKAFIWTAYYQKVAEPISS